MADVDRKAMEAALKDYCVPVLRQTGFKGSFPDLYRETNGFIALVNFQFSSSGGSFCVNVSYADRERRNIYFRPETSASKLRVSQARDQLRLGASSQGGDMWFSFGKTSYGQYRGTPSSVSEIVQTINKLMTSQAEGWWREKENNNAGNDSGKAA